MTRRRAALFLGIVLFATGAIGQPDPAASREAFRKAAVSAAQHYDARILRDTWGVPHVFGKTDADASFGLAYAHAEDDFGTIQDVFISTRSLGGSVNGADAATIDFMVHLLGVWGDVNAKYDSDLRPETRALCEAYAAGINLYAALHPDEVVLTSIYPVTGKDVVAGFAFRAPFFYGLDSQVLELFGPKRRREVSVRHAKFDDSGGPPVAMAGGLLTGGWPTGSNTFSVSPRRSANGETFININAHQPWTGPVTWYEAHVHSEEGWDAVGGLFPGSPIILHGHNRDLGWAHTVNRPDLADIYVLEMNPDNPNQYRFDGEWLDLEVSSVMIEVRLVKDSPGTFKIHREVLRSVHGPVLRQDHGVYAIRYAGMGDIRQVDQWYRMNKATNLDEWLAAMKMQSVASFNCGYADREGNILMLYNAKIPERAEGYDWKQYLPGNTSDTLWDTYLPFEQLPMVKNPPSGFVQSCNSTPFKTTTGEGNPDPADFPASAGIETHMTNRSLRAIELFGADRSITAEEFYAYKYDMKYSRESFVGKALESLREGKRPSGRQLRKALDLLLGWDLSTDPENSAAALAVLSLQPLYNNSGRPPERKKILENIENAARRLRKVHGRIDVPWKEVNRLHRGTLDIGSGGGPDILHAVYGRLADDGAHYVGRAGDSYVLLAAWDSAGRVTSRSIHQFGSATLRESSSHYADQSPLFVAREMKPVWFDESDIRANLEREYRPGEGGAPH